MRHAAGVPMSVPPPGGHRLLAAIDFSDVATRIVQHVAELARQRRADELHFVHVHPSNRDPEERAARQEELEAWLEARLQGADGVPQRVKVFAHELSGPPASAIAALARELPAASLVVGARARGAAAAGALGAVAEALLQGASCPVVVVRPDPRARSLPPTVQGGRGVGPRPGAGVPVPS